mmetsp:Transcript_10692/g.17701  ORF Transcript_10692/g.17701 Transcript_10692/m.17701 type:complete len:95 (-) Transcript_10692:32-316(-)
MCKHHTAERRKGYADNMNIPYFLSLFNVSFFDGEYYDRKGTLWVVVVRFARSLTFSAQSSSSRWTHVKVSCLSRLASSSIEQRGGMIAEHVQYR